MRYRYSPIGTETRGIRELRGGADAVREAEILGMAIGREVEVARAVAHDVVRGAGDLGRWINPFTVWRHTRL